MERFQLYCIRHGIAGQFGDYQDDSQRPLTKPGQEKTQRVAKRLHQLGIEFEVILSSPYLRAWQTAEILQATGLSDRLESMEFLQPGGALERLLAWLGTWRQSGAVAIVGHEPNLSTTAEHLVWGEAKNRLMLKKAGVIGLEVPYSGQLVGECDLFWLVSPRLLL
jgi:phosphohistidine phosphatase